MRRAVRWVLDGWEEPARIDQLELWGEGRDRVLALARLSIDEIERWRARGWISFDVRDKATLDEGEVCEIVFIRNLVQSSLTEFQVQAMLEELEPPYRYDPQRVVYSFRDGWVQRPPMLKEEEGDEYIRRHVFTWIDECLADGEDDLVSEVCAYAIKAVTVYRKEGEGEGEGEGA